LGRVVQREPDDERDRERSAMARPRLTDREPLAEVVHPDPDRDQQRELARRRQLLEPSPPPELIRRGGARPDEVRRPRLPALLHPLGVVDERHVAEGEAGEPEGGVPPELAPGALV